uniref:Zinc finger ZPR1-type domain-containing protein n=1 Tax=Romanomermis culicivorax TaxID=13658 RepID=A0A915K480_ROMCU
DLNRQVVKSNYASVSIPDVDFEIPSCSQAGEITTVEGIIKRATEALRQDQNHRKATNSTYADMIETFIARLEGLLNLKEEFTLIVDDPSGDSFVENPNPHQVDPNAKIVHYHRTLQQDKMLALVADDVEEDSQEASPVWESNDALRNEVLHFAVNCSNCKAPAQTNMKLMNIPYFKEVLIMATNCDNCGVRTSEVKSGTGISDKGSKLTLQILNSHDLTRDVLKSETCCLKIPELDLEMGMGVLGGRFTTVEGILIAIKTELIERGGLILGDSAEAVKKQNMSDFLDRLEEAISLKRPIQLILDDPAGNSYIQSFAAPQVDEQLKVEYYDRSFDQNEELGLNDMKVENYSENNVNDL